MVQCLMGVYILALDRGHRVQTAHPLNTAIWQQRSKGQVTQQQGCGEHSGSHCHTEVHTFKHQGQGVREDPYQRAALSVLDHRVKVHQELQRVVPLVANGLQ